MNRLNMWLAPLKKQTITPLAIDLGTSFTRISYQGQMVMQVPTVVSRQLKVGLSAGMAAARIQGKHPQFINVETPVHHSEVVSYQGLVIFLQQLIEELYRHQIVPRVSLLTAKVLVCDEVTTVQRSTLKQAFLEAGLQSVTLIDKRVACQQLLKRITKQDQPSGLVIDSGAGGTDCVVIHQGEVVTTSHSNWGGKVLDLQIRDAIRTNEHLEIGWQTVEKLKIGLACLPFWMLEDGVELGVMQQEWMHTSMQIVGKNITTFLPEKKRIEARSLLKVCHHSMEEIVIDIQNLTENIDIEIMRLALEQEIIILGQHSLLRGFSQTINSIFHTDVYQVEETGESLLRGLESEIA